MKKNNEMQEEMKQLQFKYKNEPEILNQEVMALYKREGISPLSGCFSSIIQIILLFSVFLLVRSPLTYMVKMDTDVLSKIETAVEEQELTTKNAYKEIAVIQYFRNIEDIASIEIEGINIEDYIDEINLNMDFFGIDLSQVPTRNWQNVKTLIIPFLYVLSSFISMKMTTNTNQNKKNNKKLLTDGTEQEEEYNPAEDMSKTMSWMMPIMSVSIACIAPLGLALYWLMNNILMIIERIIYNKILNKEEAKNNA